MKYPTFKSSYEYEDFIRNGGVIYDVVEVEGVIFTQDEYDQKGFIVSYGNKNEGLGMDVDTANRYMSTADAIVSIFSTNCFRDDVTYID